MNKIIIVFVIIFLNMINVCAQIKESEIKTNIDSITVFIQKCNYLNYNDIKSWKQLDFSGENKYAVEKYSYIEDSIFTDSGVIQMGKGNFQTCQIVYDLKIYHFDNECKTIKITANIFLKDTKIAQKLFIQNMCTGIVEYKKDDFVLGHFNTENNDIRGCSDKYRVRGSSILVDNSKTREVIILNSMGQQIFNSELKDDLIFNVNDMKNSGLYFILIKDDNIWCSSKFIKN